jgi:hypothetical protein
MMFEEFSELCRSALINTSRELDELADSYRISGRDDAAAQMSQLLELAAKLAVSKHVARATFLNGCEEYFDAANKE